MHRPNKTPDQRRQRPPTDDASPTQRARTEATPQEPTPRQAAPPAAPQQHTNNTMPPAMADLLAVVAIGVAPDVPTIRAAIRALPGLVPTCSACPASADPGAKTLLVGLLRSPDATIPPANIAALGSLVAAIGKTLWAAATADTQRSLSQVRAAARPYLESMQSLLLAPALMAAVDDRATPRGLNGALEAHRLAALEMMPKEAINIVSGRATKPTTPLACAGVRFPLGMLLAPLLAAELSGAARQRVTLLVAQSILFGDDAALDRLDLPPA